MLARTLEKYRWSWLALVAVGAIWATPGRAVAADRTTVEALIRINRTQPAILKGEKFDATEFEIYKRTQSVLFLSRPVLETALQDFGAGTLPLLKGEHDQVGWLTGHIKIDFPKDSELMRVSLSGENSQDLAAAANAAVDSYFKVVVSREMADRRTRREELEKRVNAYNDDIRAKSTEVHLLAAALGTADVPEARSKSEVLQKEAAYWQSQSLALQSKVLHDGVLLLQMEKDSDESRNLNRNLATARAELEVIDKRREETTHAFLSSVKYSADLEMRRDELAAIKAVAREVAEQAEWLNLEVNAPPRETLYQRAAP